MTKASEVRQVSEPVRANRPLFGVEISVVAERELVAELLAPIPRGSGARLVATMNLDHVVNLRINPAFRDAYRSAWRVTIDGAPVFAYARLAGVRVPERVPGADLFATLVPMFRPGVHRLFFVVSSPDVVAAMTELLCRQGFARDELAFDIPPFGFQNDAAASASLAARIKAFNATYLVLAVGAPKSEIWTCRHAADIGDVNVLCIGAAVEFVTGLKRRAPRWMRRAGLEWLWRVGSEPKRLFKRYFVDSFGFARAIAADRRSRGQSVT
ncbi:WecB/TagA/CpsF family glycosyltransferase [Sphingomonas mesophila]|uniref:WecB/TagA/CpsF family glycosyltransferase n=1 Tax=Sphingomonas mesophila TaxID=2303576 RepID=UPI0013C2AD9E|nr:WecB/TagA/CpsF family glycosyltransferase [Sphingomonas mesophila]